MLQILELAVSFRDVDVVCVKQEVDLVEMMEHLLVTGMIPIGFVSPQSSQTAAALFIFVLEQGRPRQSTVHQTGDLQLLCAVQNAPLVLLRDHLLPGHLCLLDVYSHARIEEQVPVLMMHQALKIRSHHCELLFSHVLDHHLVRLFAQAAPHVPGPPLVDLTGVACFDIAGVAVAVSL